MQRPESIEDTAELISAAGGVAVPRRVDHTVPGAVEALMMRIEWEQNGRLGIRGNHVLGGDPLVSWSVPFWEQDLQTGLLMQNQAFHRHITTGWHAAPRLVCRRSGLIVEVADGC